MHRGVFWDSRTVVEPSPALEGSVTADAVVVGGGIAGLSAAQWLREEAGLAVVLVEAGVCGSGATGRSSGFITPDSELELRQLARRFGDADAATLWRNAIEACGTIGSNIARFEIGCDRVPADSLFVATSGSGAAGIREEHRTHERLGFESHLYEPAEMGAVLGGQGYHAAVRSPGTFGMDGRAYAQGLKHALQRRGVRIFENSPAVRIDADAIHASRGRVSAPGIVICLDRFAPALAIARRDNYPAQTFIMVSEPLPETIWSEVFPDGPMLVWDTDLIYQYFRRTGDGRLLVGGGRLRDTYAGRESEPEPTFEHLRAYIGERFPILRDTRWTHGWPGLIGVTKDLLPLAGPSPVCAGHTWAMCAAGLPWSTLAGRIAAESLFNAPGPLHRFFDPGRAFSTVEPLQPVLGRPATFALSHWLAKNTERGTGTSIRRRQLALIAALMGVGLGVGVVAGRRLGGR